MDFREITALGELIGQIVGDATAPLMRRIGELEATIAALPVPIDGKDGAPGEPGRDGADGATGADGADGAPGLDGKDADPALIAELVAAEVAKLPPAKDGEPGLPGADGAPGLDGKDADPALIAELVAAEVAKLPPAKDGEPGLPGADGAPGLDGKDGASGTDGKDGEPGADGKDGVDGAPGADGIGMAAGFIDQDGVLILSATDGSIHKLCRVVGKDGEPGPAGLGFDDLTVEHDGDRSIVLGFRRGADTKRFSINLPVILDRGVWREGQYERGDAVSFGGSLFIAQEATTEKPEAGKAWRLAVKRGRDGKDGVVRQVGPPAPLKIGPSA